MQAIAVGTGSPCLVPTARQQCRHPGAISEIAYLSRPYLSFFSFLLCFCLPAKRDPWRSFQGRIVSCLLSLIGLAFITLMLLVLSGQGR